MALSTTAQRLRFIMSQRNMNQTELLEACNTICKRLGIKELGKSAISQYVNGKVVPKQDKIIIIADALDVSPAWLIGLDSYEKSQNDSICNGSSDGSTDETTDSIAKRLSRVMHETETTLEQLAEKTGISKSTIQRYTSGKTKSISTEKAKLLAQALGVTYSYISGVENEHVSAGTVSNCTEGSGIAVSSSHFIRMHADPLGAVDSLFSQLQDLLRQLQAQVSLTRTEQTLVHHFRGLPKSDQNRVLAYIDALIDVHTENQRNIDRRIP